jgi:hypothetical protein
MAVIVLGAGVGLRFLLAAGIVHGKSPGRARLPRAAEQIVFEIRDSNFASRAHSEGYFITAGGQVKKFDYFDDKPRRCCVINPERPSHADILARFGARPQVVAQIPAAELAIQRAKIPATRAGALVCASTCNDAGGLSTSAWTVDERGIYSWVPLGGGGDISCRNLAPEAGAIVAWLRARPELSALYQREPCSFPDRVCTGEPCVRAPGVDCVDPTYCASVPDCRWCKGGVCVTAADGSKHCTFGEPRCGNMQCACQGAVCAGGPVFCRDLPDGSIACHP